MASQPGDKVHRFGFEGKSSWLKVKSISGVLSL